MDSLSLFDADVRPVETVALSRSTDPETSREAAATISGAIERQIVNAFCCMANAKFTDDELCFVLSDWHPPTVKSARSRLTKAGRLVDSGKRRPSNRGRSMVVWTLR